MKTQHILVPTDFSAYASQAVAEAIQLGQSLHARLTLLHVIERPVVATDLGSVLSAPLEECEAAAQHGMQEVLKQVQDAGLQGDIEMANGVPFQSIVDMARDQQADLIVMGTHGLTGLTHILIGSVAEKVVRLAPCPVLVTRPHQAASRPHFLVPLDFSADSEEALTAAMRLAQARHARLTLLHVLEHPPIGTREVPMTISYAQEVLHAVDQSMARYLTRVQGVGLKGDIAMMRGHPLQHILDIAHTQHVDLIVMGTHGRTGFKRVWLGSVAENVVRLAPCPVLVTHRHDHTSA